MHPALWLLAAVLAAATLALRLNRRAPPRPPRAAFPEPRLAAPAVVADARSGRFRPEAVGFAPRELHVARLSGLRARRWNVWTFAGAERFAYVALFDLGWACAARVVTWTPARGAAARSALAVLGSRLADHGGALGAQHFRAKGVEVEMAGARVAVHAPGVLTETFDAEVDGEAESLSALVPWAAREYHATWHRPGMACGGALLATLHCGRGRWPHRAHWRWGCFSGRTQCGRALSVNVAGGYSDGLGACENAIWVDGRLHKLSGDLMWSSSAESDWTVTRMAKERGQRHEDRPGLRMRFEVDADVSHSRSAALGLLGHESTELVGRYSGTVELEFGSLSFHDVRGWMEVRGVRW